MRIFKYRLLQLHTAFVIMILLLASGLDLKAQVNYVRVWEALSPQTDPNTMATKPKKELRQTTEYMDGLGRALQTVVKEGSMISAGTAYDLVQPVVYDEFGREVRKYLPFAANTQGTAVPPSGGLLKDNPLVQQPYFYSNGNVNSPVKDQGETVYYGQTDFETSPLNRPVKDLPAGNNWAGANRGTSTFYGVNTLTDDVVKWGTTPPTGINFTAFTRLSSYPAGVLTKQIFTDANNFQTIEFKDKDGQVIAKKVQLTAGDDTGPGSGHSGWIYTYYIYNELNQLVAVIQPEGVHWLNFNLWNASDTTFLAEQCFRYAYDSVGRLVMKKIPGAGLPTLMVYDKWDRLVLIQPGHLKAANQWLYTKYDVLNRPIITGLYTNSAATQEAMQTIVNGAGLGRFENFAAGASQPQYTLNLTFPSVAATTVLTATYYDTYDWTTNLNSGFKTKANNFDAGLTTANQASFPEPLTQSFQTLGLATGIWQNTSPATYSSMIYDEKGRVIQTRALNITGGMDTTTILYCFNGAIAIQAVAQKNGISNEQHEIWTRMTYDDLWRITNVEKRLKHPQVNSNVYSAWKSISRLTYDALGQVASKNLGIKSTDGGTVARNDFRYNIRGWLLSINKDFVAVNQTDRYFGMELGYDKSAPDQVFTGFNYGGNITGQVWKSKGDGVKRSYNYFYDKASRLLGADYIATEGGSYHTYLGNSIDPNTAYDYNGNIKRLIHRGWVGGNEGYHVDVLNYEYALSGRSNRLAKVTDEQTTATGQGDFTDGNTSGDDYAYDGGGNLTKDLNKKISNITYNHLNLPLVVTVKKDDFVTDKGSITYLYDAGGVKLKKTVVQLNDTILYNGVQYPTRDTTVTTYLGGVVYEKKSYSNASLSALGYKDSLQFIAHEEGRIRLLSADTATCSIRPVRFAFDYFLKDHLGNTRAVVTEQVEALCYPASTLEPDKVAMEKKLFTIQDAQLKNFTLVPGASSYPQFDTTLYQVHGGVAGQRNGLGIVLKVMAGDSVKFHVQSIYTPTTNAYGGVSPATMAVSELLAGFLGNEVAGGKGLTQSGLETLNPLTVFSPYNTQKTEASNRPKAYLNYLLFNDQFKYISGSAAPVNSGTGTTPVYTHIQQFSTTAPVVASKSGYIYIFVSNESNIPVFFDNLTIRHTPGPILEETHYYPFGLNMEGVTSRAMGKLENKKDFNGNELQNKEFSDGSGLELYDFNARTYDQQIGRFIQIDPMTDEGGQETLSPYHFSYNNPIRYNDPDGREGQDCCGLSDVTKWVSGKVDNLVSNVQTSFSVIAGTAAAGLVQAGENFNTRWENRADPIHQAIDNPLSLLGGPAGAEVKAIQTAVGMEANATKTAVNTEAQITKNAAQGKAFEAVTTKKLEKAGNTDIAREVTIKPNGASGKVRMDHVSKKDGNIVLTESKSSPTAGFTKNQKVGYPAIEKSGGVVVGNKGAASGYPKGTVIPPTKVQIERPRKEN